MAVRDMRVVFLCLTCFLSLAPWTRTVAEDATSAAIGRMADDLKFLSSDALEGRNVGSDGIAQAAEYIAERFQQLGLRTDSFDGTPFQDFTIPGPAKLGPAENNRLQFTGVVGLPTLQLGEDFSPVSLGANGKFDGQVVFCGYGITAPDLAYDDYAGVDVEGKIVLVLRKEPRQEDAESKFDGTSSSEFARFTSKELNAALHKAGALIIVNDSRTVAASGDELLGVSAAGSALTDNTVPTLFCLRSVVDPLVKQATGKTLAELEAEIDSDEQPRSQVLEGITAEGEAKIEQSQTAVRNVIGYLPGSGTLADEFVVVGAHYDHVGMGGPGSLAPGTIAVHNGADDNASGTTTMLEVARRMASESAQPRRGIIFMAFTGEEKGLLGSKYYARNPRWPLENTVAMVNMDMVGRLSENTLTVYGTGTATTFDDMLERFNTATKFNLDKQPAGFGPSDHSSFYEMDVPVFHFFTGLHNDYHRPSDDFEKANLAGMARIATFVTDVTRELATVAERPSLIKSSAVARIGRGPRGPGRQDSPPRAVLGIQLDLESPQAKVAAAMADGPAARAGLQAGDVINKIDEVSVQNVEELRGVLSTKKPGETIKVSIQRAAGTLVVELTLGSG